LILKFFTCLLAFCRCHRTNQISLQYRRALSWSNCSMLAWESNFLNKDRVPGSEIIPRMRHYVQVPTVEQERAYDFNSAFEPRPCMCLGRWNDRFMIKWTISYYWYYVERMLVKSSILAVGKYVQLQL